MSVRTAVVVDPYSSGNMLAPALTAAGFQVVAVTSTEQPPAIYRPSFRPDDFARRLVFDGDLEAVVDRLRPYRPEVVVPGAEPGVDLADRIAARLTPHLANDPALTSARRHKGDMTAAVAAAGLPVIRTLGTDDEAELGDWLADNGLLERDLVLKPAQCGGTDGVTLVPAGHDWSPVFRALLTEPNSYGLPNEQVVVQEYVHGVEYFVDTFTFDGRHTVDVIARYGKVRNSDRMAVYESTEFVGYTDEGHAGLVDYTKGVLDALGIRFGAAHTEVMVTPDGPRLIECGARIAGGGTPAVSRKATGGNVVDRLVRYLNGDRDIDDAYALHRSVMTVFLMVSKPGVVRNAEVYEEIRDLPTFHYLRCAVRNGDTVTPSSDLPSSLKYGLAVLIGDEPEQVYADHAAIREIESRLVVEKSG